MTNKEKWSFVRIGAAERDGWTCVQASRHASLWTDQSKQCCSHCATVKSQHLSTFSMFYRLFFIKGYSSAAAVSPAGGRAEAQRAAHQQAEGQAGGQIYRARILWDTHTQDLHIGCNALKILMQVIPKESRSLFWIASTWSPIQIQPWIGWLRQAENIAEN